MAATITTNGRKKISTFKNEFTEKFPFLTIQFLDSKRKEYDENQNLATVRAKKGADISISGQNKINSLESKFDKILGVAVEVCYSKGNKLIRTKSNNDKTLSELNKWCEVNGYDRIGKSAKLEGRTNKEKEVSKTSKRSVKEQIFSLKSELADSEAENIENSNTKFNYDLEEILKVVKSSNSKNLFEITAFKNNLEQWEEFCSTKINKTDVFLKITRNYFDSYWKAKISKKDLISVLEEYIESNDLDMSFQINWIFDQPGEAYNDFDVELLEYDINKLPDDCFDIKKNKREINPYKIFENYSINIDDSETLVKASFSWIECKSDTKSIFKLYSDNIDESQLEESDSNELDVDEIIRKMQSDLWGGSSDN